MGESDRSHLHSITAGASAVVDHHALVRISHYAPCTITEVKKTWDRETVRNRVFNCPSLE